VDLRRLRLQEWLAGGFGVVLLGAMFLHWYGSSGTARTAWQAFSALDALLAVVGLMAVAIAAGAATQRAQAVPTALASVLLPVAAVATGLVVYRAASPPHLTASVPSGPRPTGYIPSGGTSREIGLWIGLAACVGIVGAAFAVIRDQSFPRALRETGGVRVETLPTPPREGAGRAGS
jgi:carbon starvation protein CstA